MNRRNVIQSVLAGAAAAALQDNILERIRAASSAVNGRWPAPLPFATDGR